MAFDATDIQRTPRARAGTSLVELLAALPIMAIATGIALLLLIQSATDRRSASAGLLSTRELRQARHLLHAELSPLAGRDLITWRDSLLQVRVHLGVLRVCASAGSAIEVGAAPGDSAPEWVASARAGDHLTLWHAPLTPTSVAQEDSAVLTASPAGVAAGLCAGAGVARRWRLALSIPADDVWSGAPVILRRDVQYVHYRSNGLWWLGRRTHDAGGWDVVQPVFGPLETPARGGMRVRPLNAHGTPTARAESVAVVSVALRMAASIGYARRSNRIGGSSDSTRVEVALRGDAWNRGRP